MPAKQHFAEVNGKRIAYLEAGAGDPIVLLHGNPTSSFLWRNIIPALEACGRVIAPDLIGQGDSDKLPASEGADRYPLRWPLTISMVYSQHRRRSKRDTRDSRLGQRAWGSIGRAFNPESVKGIAYMEAIVTPITWEDWPESARGIFKGFRSPKGEDLVLERNMFVEAVLPSSIIRELSDDEMATIARPLIHPSIVSQR